MAQGYVALSCQLLAYLIFLQRHNSVKFSTVRSRAPSYSAFAMADRYIPEHRRTQFKAKNTFKPDELRRRREEQQVEIRRQKREDNLAKRRGIQRDDGQIGVGLGADLDSDDEAGTIESEVRALLRYLYELLTSSLAQYRTA